MHRMVSCFIVNMKGEEGGGGRGREGEGGGGRGREGEGGRKEEERGREGVGSFYITIQPRYSGAFTDSLFCQVSWHPAKTVETSQHQHHLLNDSIQ